jgi:amidophosphoribosyltransferase
VVRHFGAKEVYFVSACPPVKYPDFYGIDIPSRSELIAYEKTNEEIREYIGADMLLYQTIEDVEEAVLRK